MVILTQRADSPVMSEFLELNSLYNHMKEKTCWKSKEGSTIYLILSNKKFSLMNSYWGP